MKTSTRLYACLKLLTMLHIVEQLIFGMQDLHELQHLMAVYENHFGDTNGSLAVLLAIAAGLAALVIRCILKGGGARFAAMFILGLPTIGELHHLFETVQTSHYSPGAVTALPSVICGVLFLRALVKEYRPSKTVRVNPARGSLVREIMALRITAG